MSLLHTLYYTWLYRKENIVSPDLLFLTFLFSEVHLWTMPFWTAAAQWGTELISDEQIKQSHLFRTNPEIEMTKREHVTLN